MKRTTWFDGSVKPVHVGPYKRKYCGRVFFSWWNGEFWGWLDNTANTSKFWHDCRSVQQELPWCGLTQPA